MDINPQLSDMAAEMITDEWIAAGPDHSGVERELAILASRITDDQIGAAIEEAAAMDPSPKDHPPFKVLDMALPQPPPEVGPPVTLYSFGFDAEELICVYGAMRTYLKALAAQDLEDLEMILRTAAVMIQMKPRAVEASKSLALKAAGMENRNA